MDAPGADRAALLAQLRDRFSDGCVDFENGAPTRSMEDIAMLDESAMNEFLDSGAVADKRLKAMISARTVPRVLRVRPRHGGHRWLPRRL